MESHIRSQVASETRTVTESEMPSQIQPQDKIQTQRELDSVSVIIPTYRREAVLIDTIDQLLALAHKAREIIIVDQTLTHNPKTREALESLHNTHQIHWLRLKTPSIPQAMNHGLSYASGDVVLFLDDDIRVSPDLVYQHGKQYQQSQVSAVAGRVIQPWHGKLPSKYDFESDRSDDPDAFTFNSTTKREISRFMAGNVSFRTKALIEVGGFDENFVKVAFRFEAECASRFVSAGFRIFYHPEAVIDHLKVTDGGTRTFGEHFRTIKPGHSVGRYYYLLMVKNQKNRWVRFFTYPFRTSITRFHLKHPWWIPMTIVSELAGLVWALWLSAKGQKLVGKGS